MTNGNINQFLKTKPKANRMFFVRIITLISSRVELRNSLQLVDVANGLEYLHSVDLVHGDLKGVSFASLAGQAVITDCPIGKCLNQFRSARNVSRLWSYFNHIQPWRELCRNDLCHDERNSPLDGS